MLLVETVHPIVHMTSFSPIMAMFVALRGRRWVLAAHAVTVLTQTSAGQPAALANAFTTPAKWLSPISADRRSTAGPRAYTAAIVFAPNVGKIELRLGGVADVLPCGENIHQIHARLVQPGDQLDSSGRAAPGSFAPERCTKNATAALDGLRGCATIDQVQTVRLGSKTYIDISVMFGGGTTSWISYQYGACFPTM